MPSDRRSPAARFCAPWASTPMSCCTTAFPASTVRFHLPIRSCSRAASSAPTRRRSFWSATAFIARASKDSKIAFLISIDHHVSGRPFAHVNWIDPHAVATAEMVFRLAREAGVKFSPEIATCLYTALMTDTGSFMFQGTNENTFALARELVLAGADPAHCARGIYFAHSARQDQAARRSSSQSPSSKATSATSGSRRSRWSAAAPSKKIAKDW